MVLPGGETGVIPRVPHLGTRVSPSFTHLCATRVLARETCPHLSRLRVLSSWSGGNGWLLPHPSDDTLCRHQSTVTSSFNPTRKVAASAGGGAVLGDGVGVDQ